MGGPITPYSCARAPHHTPTCPTCLPTNNPLGIVALEQHCHTSTKLVHSGRTDAYLTAVADVDALLLGLPLVLLLVLPLVLLLGLPLVLLLGLPLVLLVGPLDLDVL